MQVSAALVVVGVDRDNWWLNPVKGKSIKYIKQSN